MNLTSLQSPEEYAQMDANDESLARWKASLGIGATPAGDASGPKVSFSYVVYLRWILVDLLICRLRF